MRAKAKAVAQKLEWPGKHDGAIRVRVEVGSVFENVDGAPRRKHAFIDLETGRFTLTGGTVTMTVDRGPVSEEERKRLDLEMAEREYQNRLRQARLYMLSASNDKRARDVQDLLVGELTPQDMGHIADLIDADDGALKGLVTRSQIERFKRSINHPAVYGARSRHIVSAQQPPPDPMREDEARAFILDIAARWLERKAGFPSSAP